MEFFGPNAEPHDQHPERAWVVVEQPRGEERRLEYDPETGAFVPDGRLSLVHMRDVDAAYGWVVGFGEPPELHFDVLVMTEARPGPGDVLEVMPCGIFRRADGDHKLVAIDVAATPDYGLVDLLDLPPAVLAMIQGLYPRVGPGEGWAGAAAARAFLEPGIPSHD